MISQAIAGSRAYQPRSRLPEAVGEPAAGEHSGASADQQQRGEEVAGRRRGRGRSSAPAPTESTKRGRSRTASSSRRRRPSARRSACARPSGRLARAGIASAAGALRGRSRTRYLRIGARTMPATPITTNAARQPIPVREVRADIRVRRRARSEPRARRWPGRGPGAPAENNRRSAHRTGQLRRLRRCRRRGDRRTIARYPAAAPHKAVKPLHTARDAGDRRRSGWSGPQARRAGCRAANRGARKRARRSRRTQYR